MTWASLHTHSQYSVLDALPSVKDLAKEAAGHGMTALALTDHGNLYGAVEFYQECEAHQVKPLIGCELYVAPGSRLEKSKAPGGKVAHHLVLLAKDQEGYRNLCTLSSLGFLEGFYYFPRVDKELLRRHSKGLICLSACLSGEIAQTAQSGTPDALRGLVAEYQEIYGSDFYLEIQRHPMERSSIEEEGFLEESWLYQQYDSFIADQRKVNTLLISLAKEKGIPLVATNDIHYLRRSDWRAHEILLNIQSGEPCEVWERDSLGNPKRRHPNPKRRTYPSHEYYFKSPQEMASLFSDLPEALSTSLEIAKKCQLKLDLKTKHYPVYRPPTLGDKKVSDEERRAASEAYLKQLCEEAIPKRYTEERLLGVSQRYPGEEPLQVVRGRLKMELEVIIPKGMCDYLLIVWDFIDWAKRRGIPVGPGRGSGAGSIVLYLIGVTDIEPLAFNLFFERFINPERLSDPDIDVDICMERRQEVIEYTVGKYGRESVAQIITFGTMKARMAIKDVGRVLSIPLPKVNAIAALVPDDLGITLERAVEIDPDLHRLVEEDEETARLIDLAKKLEGGVRSTGIHAAGVIISAGPLMDYIPICTAKDSEIYVTQYSMKPVEKVGMLKIDFLGLKTLTSIDLALKAIKASKGVEIDPLTLPIDDPAAFKLLNQGRTLGVFQIETGGMQELARNLHLDKFEEIIAVVSLYRPGPMEMIPSFIERKHGREPIDYDHPLLREILGETYGIMVYQEQVMQIAKSLASFTLSEGDVLRRAMGKKIMEEMAAQREKFSSGAVANGIPEELALRIFDKMEQFAKYGFNKSHAACYAFLTYVTAYLKANYPAEWMAALMTCDRHDTLKVAKFIREAQSLGLSILPPDVNESGTSFLAAPCGIRLAMSGIKGIGMGVVDAIVEERDRSGPYESLLDFLQRLESKKVGKKVIETLIDAGCFDFTLWSRDLLREQLSPLYETAAREQKERATGVLSLFSLMEPKGEEAVPPPLPAVVAPRTQKELLLREKELLGFFLTGHPIGAYAELLTSLSCLSLTDAERLEHNAVFRTAFLVETITTKIASKTGKKFAILTISDSLEAYELPIWSELYEEKGHLLIENQLLYAVLQIDKRDGSLKFQVKWFDDLTQFDGGQPNEAMVRACDAAYDKAKSAPNFRDSGAGPRKFASKSRPNNSPKSGPYTMREEPKPATSPLQIHLDIDKTRLSHLMTLKALFRSQPGGRPVQLHFLSSSTPIARLTIDDPWGIASTPELHQAIQEIASVISISP